MPLSHLDENPALVVIDMQKGIVALPTAHPMDSVIGNVAGLCRAFRARGLPVVLVNVAGRPPGRVEASFNFTPPADWTNLIPELNQQPDDYITTKENIGAFYGTALERILRRRNVTQIVLAGVATSAGVEATARQAYDQGYNVVTVTDAMTDLRQESHDHTIENVFPRISERAATAEIVAQVSNAAT